MLATFIIGLREGLEAALIVSIVATFLRRHGHPLRPMWTGVGLGIGLSILVGTAITLAERALSQTAQEAMEGVIGLIATAMVTTMVLWMAKHSRSMKRDLEQAATLALASGTSRALVLMAFLAIVKEGFETAVLLLATFQAAGDASFAAAGAVLGMLAAVGLGLGLFRGALRLNPGRFFRYTSIFLVFVAGGLLVTSVRKLHEAGVLNAGQQRTVDLAWLAPVGSVRGTVVTGVLGIPADPRVIEILAYAAYVGPMLAFVLWPRDRRPGVRTRLWLQVSAALIGLIGAVALAILPVSPAMAVPAKAPIQDETGTTIGAVVIHGGRLEATGAGVDLDAALTATGTEQRAALMVAGYTASAPAVDPSVGAPRLTLDDVTRLNGGRLPVGISAARNPGPFDATWRRSGGVRVWLVHGVVCDAVDDRRSVVTLGGGGLGNPRTITMLPGGWGVTPQRQQEVAVAAQAYESDAAELRFWTRFVPLLLILVVAACTVSAVRTQRVRRQEAPPSQKVLVP